MDSLAGFPVLDILRVGLSGLCFLLALLAYLLITREQRREGSPRKGILQIIRVFIATNFLAGILCAVSGYIVSERTPSAPQKKDISWQITGSFEDPKKLINDWQTAGQLELFPPGIKADVDKNGHFTISMELEEGRIFDDVIESLQYKHRLGAVVLYPQVEYLSYKDGKPTKLDKVLPHIRAYKPIPLQRFDQNN
jgi:heme A synthase